MTPRKKKVTKYGMYYECSAEEKARIMAQIRKRGLKLMEFQRRAVLKAIEELENSK